MPTVTNDRLDQLIANELPSLIELRHDLHAHPQTNYEETYASAAIQRELGKMGVPFQADLAITGVVGWITPDGGAKGAAVGLRADIDALPIEEATGLPYASKTPGRMHACGHDGHTTMLVGAARVLSKLRGELPRPVKLLFQPAEEGGAGGLKMVEAGVLEKRVGGLKVGALFALHGYPPLALGKVATRRGAIMASTDPFYITVKGSGGHGATPHLTRDPIVAGAAIVTALQTIVSRNINPCTPAVVTVGVFQANGASNIIPDNANLVGTIRTVDPGIRDLIGRRVTDIVRQVARAHGCEVDVRVDRSYPPTINDPATADYALDVARRALGAQNVDEMDQPIMAAEDFAYYGPHTATAYALLGLADNGPSAFPGLHTPRFDFADAALPVGIRLLCRLALDAADLPTGN